MHKGWLLVGMLFIIFGSLAAAVGVSATSLTFSNDDDFKPVSVTKSWNISGYFEKNRRLTVSITVNRDWGVLAADYFGDLPPEFSKLNETLTLNKQYYIYLYVNVKDPKGGITRFCVLYFAVNDPQYIFPRLDLFAVAVSSNAGGLEFPDDLLVGKDNGYLYLKREYKICGITHYDGVYNISIEEDPALTSIGPPLKLELSSQLVSVEHPYQFLTYIGGVFITGGAISFVAWKRDEIKRKKLRKRVSSRIYSRKI